MYYIAYSSNNMYNNVVNIIIPSKACSENTILWVQITNSRAKYGETCGEYSHDVSQ